MKIARFFTLERRLSDVPFETRTATIRNFDGSPARSVDVVAPAAWPQLSVDILADKYLRRAGVPTTRVRVSESGVPDSLSRWRPDPGASFRGETDAREVFDRLAGCWTYWGWKAGVFEFEEDALAFRDEMTWMLAHQMAAPNSPQWFNTGLHWAYGITGPAQGHYYTDIETGETRRSENAYEHPQPHACFILGLEDDLVNEGGIMDLWAREVRCFKFGSGVGSNFSALRGEGEALSGGGKSSGMMSFLRVGDRSAGAIKSGGTTRRAAKMVVVDVDHPDVMDFIRWKSDEEKKVAALVAGSKLVRDCLSDLLRVIAASPNKTSPTSDPVVAAAITDALSTGLPEQLVNRALEYGREGVLEVAFPEFDTDWQGEAYLTVAGQNANNSVRIPDAFMQALDHGLDWELIERTTGEVAATIPAKEIWTAIVRAAWESADPGVQFDTTINEWHTCPNSGRIRASNPCSEFLFLDDTACNLASLNLRKFQTETGELDLPAFEHAVALWTITLEISVAMAQLPSRRVAELTHQTRTLGLGYANLGAFLMAAGIAYDSPRGRAIAAGVTAVMTGLAYRTSAQLAAELGPFELFAKNREAMLRVINNHFGAALGSDGTVDVKGPPPVRLNKRFTPAYLREAAIEAWDQAYRSGESHGYRNAQVSVLAPTGTISLVMGCDTTGIEPDFSLVKFKSLAGGGSLRIVNETVPSALRHLGYTEEQIADITAYISGHGTFEEAPTGMGLEGLRSALGLSGMGLVALETAAKSAYHIDFLPGLDRERLWTTDAQWQALNAYVCGHGTIEGAPHLKPEHLPVFDCASPCGEGKRSLSWRAHVDMMAAVQSFISGAISKTVNLPATATMKDISKAYSHAWASGVKCVAIYRDGSKLSQPLSASAPVKAITGRIPAADSEGEEDPAPASFPQEPAGFPVDQNGLAWGSRVALPTRRHGVRTKARVGGQTVYLSTGEYEDGSLGEIFIDMHKEGAAFRSLMNCFAVAVSMGLQHGVPLEKFVHSFAGQRFEPAGPVSGHDRVKRASSIIDYIFRELGISYLGREDLADVEAPCDGAPWRTPAADKIDLGEQGAWGFASDAHATSPSPSALARSAGYTGDACPACGGFAMRRSGTCQTCEACGHAGGCG
ncbi:MAG: adenosylcobalamin-dependent ribonucleoside-diphosphate reductase [Sumerlaeia bacterium]